MSQLPAVITRFDEAGQAPPDERPETMAVHGETKDCHAAIVIGEGSADDMTVSGAWIQMDKWTAYDENDPRSIM